MNHDVLSFPFRRTGPSVFAAMVAASLFLPLFPLTARAQSGNLASGPHALSSNTTGSNNTAFGEYGLTSNTVGSVNTGLGLSALYSNTTGTYNTALGPVSLYYNTTGNFNTASGVAALQSNTVGNYNVANGYLALFSNTTNSGNVALGYAALYYNTADNNVAIGNQALYSNTTGYANTGVGYASLLNNTTGYANQAIGYLALQTNTTGYFNSAIGLDALYTNTTGFNNVADGAYSLYYNTTGSYNTGLGVGALLNNTAGSGNIAIGYYAAQGIGTDNNIEIGNYVGQKGDNGVIRIGTSTNVATYIAGISGVTASEGVAVYVNSNGQLYTLTSSRHFKNDIQDMGDVTGKLMQLRPVTFKYKDSAETGEHHRQYGLIAEEVAKVYPDLVQYDKQGKPFTVYYHLLTPMLLNAVQKAHKQAEQQQAEIAALKSTQKTDIARLTSAVDELKKELKQEVAQHTTHEGGTQTAAFNR